MRSSTPAVRSLRCDGEKSHDMLLRASLSTKQQNQHEGLFAYLFRRIVVVSDAKIHPTAVLDLGFQYYAFALFHRNRINLAVHRFTVVLNLVCMLAMTRLLDSYLAVAVEQMVGTGLKYVAPSTVVGMTWIAIYLGLLVRNGWMRFVAPVLCTSLLLWWISVLLVQHEVFTLNALTIDSGFTNVRFETDSLWPWLKYPPLYIFVLCPLAQIIAHTRESHIPPPLGHPTEWVPAPQWMKTYMRTARGIITETLLTIPYMMVEVSSVPTLALLIQIQVLRDWMLIYDCQGLEEAMEIVKEQSKSTTPLLRYYQWKVATKKALWIEMSERVCSGVQL